MYTLVIDLGNSNLTFGVFDSAGDLRARFRLHTSPLKTEDEYYTLIYTLLKEKAPFLFESSSSPTLLKSTVLSSVVPSLTESIFAVCHALTNTVPLVVGPPVYPHLPLKVLCPQEIGSDLVADALAAYLQCRQSCIVVDFGTALTFTAVKGSEEIGEIAGVAIAPGIGSAVKSLSRDTAQLYQVELTLPPSVLGQNTVQAIQSGILYGYAGLIYNLVTHMKTELNNNVRVFGTGGYSRIYKDLLGFFDTWDVNLTLYGLFQVSRYTPS